MERGDRYCNITVVNLVHLVLLQRHPGFLVKYYMEILSPSLGHPFLGVRVPTAQKIINSDEQYAKFH